jgi:hypothetical protein
LSLVRKTLDLYREVPPADSADREKKIGAGARSIEPFQVSGWRGVRNAASYGFSMSLFDYGLEKQTPRDKELSRKAAGNRAE